jgi:polyisoprenoid-binding protein YceI
MLNLSRRITFVVVLLSSPSPTFFCKAETASSAAIQIESGAASFNAGTTVPGVEVKGKSNALTANVELLRSDTGLLLQHIDATLPVKSLATGMKVRDEHMRKYIFTSADGQEPDIRFTSDTATCPAAASAHAYSCSLAGRLFVRGVSRPFEINLRVKEQSGSVFRAEGDGIVKLSDYGIDAPTQFGVKILDGVKFHIDFIAKNKMIGGGR